MEVGCLKSNSNALILNIMLYSKKCRWWDFSHKKVIYVHSIKSGNIEMSICSHMDIHTSVCAYRNILMFLVWVYLFYSFLEKRIILCILFFKAFYFEITFWWIDGFQRYHRVSCKSFTLSSNPNISHDWGIFIKTKNLLVN